MATVAGTKSGALENVDRVGSRIEHDEVLQQFAASRRLALGFDRLTPSGVDLVACALASSIYRVEDSRLALALPRGRHGLAVIIGAYLARTQELRRKPGSVAVLTRSTALRRAAATLRIPTAELGECITVSALGTLPVRDGRVRPAAVSYANKRDRRGMSQADHYLLFQLPHVAPPLAHNVISTAVVDGVGSSHDSWEDTYERNLRAHRRQIWLGELADADFESFCAERSIPLFRFDWETITACAEVYGDGGGPLATRALCRAAAEGRLGPAFQVCNHARFNEELRDLNLWLSEIRRKAKPESTEEKPEPFRAAERLAALFGRMAFPVETFDAQTEFVRFVRSSSQLLRQVEQAIPALFRGRWKRAYNSHWGAVKGCAKALREIALAECPKWWAVWERVDQARTRGEKIRIVCQTQADQAALAQSLIDEGVVPPSAIGDSVDIVTFSQRDEQGEGPDDRVVLYLSPPPPWQASVYLSGERGRVEVLVYPTQVWQLRRAFARAWEGATNHAANANVLASIGFVGVATTQAASQPPALLELAPFTCDDSFATEADYSDSDGGGHVRALLEEMVSLYGQEIDPEEIGRFQNREHVSRGPTLGRRIVFAEGPTLIVDADACLDVLRTAGRHGAAKVVEKPVAEIERGNRLIVLPGSKRGSLLQELMDAWDQQLVPIRYVYENLWQAALEAAVEKLTENGLARHLGVTPGTVADWRDVNRGARWPQQRSWMREVIALSDHEKAQENAAGIVRYIQRTRGAHRFIGRLLNRAVAESVAGGNPRWVRQLEGFVGREVEGQLAAAQYLTVEEIGEPEEMPARLIGQFIDPDDATMRGAA
jgi:hypothetical protein